MTLRRPRACQGTLRSTLLMIGAVAALVACSPALNWREVEGVEGLRWWLPCKPERTEREVTLQGLRLPARLAACDVQGLTWSNMALQFPGPADAATALGHARGTLMMNLQAEETAPPQGLAGVGDGLLWLAGRRADGVAVTAVVRFRVQGRWLLQQVLMTQGGPAWPRAVDASALNTFFEGAFTRP